MLQGDPSTPWDRGPLNPDLMKNVLNDNRIGSILSGGGAWPPVGDDGKAWADEINAIQQYALDAPNNTLGIPIIYGADAVHGHNNLFDATMVPHQVGLGATFDPALAERLGQSTGRAVRATGVVWDFSPVLDTERDLRWGRSYEPFGEDPLLTGTLGAATIRGLQGHNLASGGSVAATAKHFAGYSAPDSGMDRTDATISQAELQDLHLPSFQQGIDAGVATVMVNSGSVNGEPVHASHHMLTDVLRGQLHFKGVVISDWQDVENLITKYHVAPDMEHAVALAFNAGLDMSMIPLDADGFTTALTAAVTDGLVPESRIDDAVSHILTLKFRLGLFEHPYVDASKANAAVEDPANRPLARKAAQESLVLLGNDGVLPLSHHTHRILVTGPNSDSPTNQLGGWSVAWQGAFGLPSDIPIPEVTTIKEGVQQAAGAGAQVIWKQGAPVADTTTNRNRRRGGRRRRREPVRRGPGRRRHAGAHVRAGSARRRPEGDRQAGHRRRRGRSAPGDEPPARRGRRQPDGLPARQRGRGRDRRRAVRQGQPERPAARLLAEVQRPAPARLQRARQAVRPALRVRLRAELYAL